MQIVIDKEFQALIPPLTDEEYEGLEKSILADGCRDALVLWGDILVDGHNRYEICTAHNIPFKTVKKDFASREDVKLWMIGNQLARRNINNYARTTLECLSDEIQAKQAEGKAKQAEQGGDRKTAFCEITKSEKPKVDTTKEVARRANVGEQTASRVMTINKRIDAAIANNGTVAGQKPEELKRQLMNGDITVNKAYQDLQREDKAKKKAAAMSELKDKAVNDGNVVNGDCIAEMEKLADASVDCVITDPPYGINYVSNFRVVDSEVVKAVNNDDLQSALILWEKACEVLSRKMKPDSHIYIFTSWKVYPQFAEITGRYFRIKNCLIWEKNNWSMGDLEGNYAEQYEMAIFATKGNRKLNGGRDTNILHYDRVANGSLLHSCEKPVDMLRFLISKSSNPGELVIDPFAGSGSTLVACKQAGRAYWGCELDSENYKIALGRLADGD